MAYDDLDDPRLIDGLRQKRGDAWEALYFLAAPRMLKYAKKRLSAFKAHLPAVQEEAEDIVATTFEKALRSIGTYDANKAKLTTWLFTIAKNAIYDILRRLEQSKGSADSIIVDASTPTPCGTETSRHLLENIKVDPSKFTATEHAYIQALYIENLTPEIVAENLGVKLNSVIQARRRLLQKLCKLMQEGSSVAS